jgi:hypothetical protein
MSLGETRPCSNIAGMKKRPWFFRALIAAAVVVCGIQGYQGLLRFAKTDPLRSYRSQTGVPDSTRMAVNMTNVDLKQYAGQVMVARAMIDQVEVSQDRQVSRLRGIHRGIYYAANGKQINFEAQTGLWNQVARVFEVQSSVKLTNKDMNLTTDRLLYEQPSGIVSALGQVKGKFFDGDVTANNLRYHLPTGTYEIGPVVWQGSPPATDDTPATRKTWRIKADGSRRTGDIETWRNAEATDGDIILRAPVLERNVKTDVIVAPTGGQYYSREANLRADKITVYRKEKRAVMENNVTMLIKAKEETQTVEIVEVPPLRPIVPDSVSATRPPAPTEEDRRTEETLRSGQNRRKYPTQVVCRKVEYWYAKGQRRARLTGNPQARQDIPPGVDAPKGGWRAIWATIGYYDAEKETLRLDGDRSQRVRYRASNGDDFRFLWVLVSTREGSEDYESGSAAGEFGTDDDERGGGESVPPSDEGKAPPPPTDAPRTPSAFRSRASLLS